MTTQPYVMILGDFACRMPQVVYWYESIHVPRLCNRFRELGWFPLVTHYGDPHLLEQVRDLEVAAVVPATCILDEYRQLAESVCAALAEAGVLLIPSLASVLAYENKLLQVVRAELAGIPTPRSYAVATFEDAHRAARDLGFPVIVKTPHGFASKGVHKIDNEGDLLRLLRSEVTAFEPGTAGLCPLVVQEFVPGLKGDWKILLFGEKAFPLWRKVPEGDFRASGSGLWEFSSPPDAILDFALQVKQALQVPWMSLDVVVTPDGPLVTEYQVVHFGLTACVRAKHHFRRAGPGEWIREDNPLRLEEAMADEVVGMIAHHG